MLEKAIDEMNRDNWEDVIGMVDSDDIVSDMLKKQDEWRLS